MIDPFDYKEPACALCGGKEFYAPDENAPAGRIPVKRIMAKLDESFNRNDMAEAGRLLEYWQKEAEALGDKLGELSVTDELIGYYRKVGEKEKGLAAVDKSLALLKEVGQENIVPGATIILNAATTLKAFGKAKEAIPLYERAEKVYRENLAEDDPLFAGLYNNKALSLTDLNDFAEAEKLYLTAAEIMAKKDNGKPDAAISYVNLAHCYEKEGRDKKDITDALFKAYELLNDERNERNGYYAFVLEKCAPSFGHFGYEKIAKEMKKESDEIYARN